MRLGLNRQDASNNGDGSTSAEVGDARDELKAAVKQLQSEFKAWRKRLDIARDKLREAEKRHEKAVSTARRAVDEAGKPRKLGGYSAVGVQLFDDRVVVGRESFSLTPQVSAMADTAGNLAVTRRLTLTRFALMGPFSLFAPKKTKSDTRELYLLIEGADWAKMVKCSADAGAKVRSLAAQITTAARSVEATLAHRRDAVTRAQATFNEVLGERSEIEHCVVVVREAQADTAGVKDAVARVHALVNSAVDESRATRGARKLVAEIEAALDGQEAIAAFEEEADVSDLIEEGLRRVRRFDEDSMQPFDQAVDIASDNRDAEALRQIASAMQAHAADMRRASGEHRDDPQFFEWIRLLEDESALCLDEADLIDGGEVSNATDPTIHDQLEDAEPFDGVVDSSLLIVRERYARGEITREEFLQLTEDLGG